MKSKNKIIGYYAKDYYLVISQIDGQHEEEVFIENKENEFTYAQMFLLALKSTKEIAEFYGYDYEFYNKPLSEVKDEKEKSNSMAC